MIVTIIPARGGSKSIPLKNIKLLAGKPLIYYSIIYSLSNKLVEHTVVSTDHDEIAKIAQKYNAEVPFLRPAVFAKDDSQDYEFMAHALKELESIYNSKIEYLILLRPTSPFRPKGLIDAGIKLLKSHSEATSVRSVALCKEHPYRMWIPEGNYIYGYEKNIFEPYNLPRQKLPEIFFQTGDIEIVRRETLIKGSVSGGKVLPLILKSEDMLDIDYESDFIKAEKWIKEQI